MRDIVTTKLQEFKKCNQILFEESANINVDHLWELTRLIQTLYPYICTRNQPFCSPGSCLIRSFFFDLPPSYLEDEEMFPSQLRDIISPSWLLYYPKYLIWDVQVSSWSNAWTTLTGDVEEQQHYSELLLNVQSPLSKRLSPATLEWSTFILFVSSVLLFQSLPKDHN